MSYPHPYQGDSLVGVWITILRSSVRMEVMLKYFDNDFFKFMFGFLAILAVSFGLIYASLIWGDAFDTHTSYVEADASTSQ
jgi:hypothetical protein